MAITGISTRTFTMIDLSRGRRVVIRISYSASSHIATIKPTARLAANHSYRILVDGITSVGGGLPLRADVRRDLPDRLPLRPFRRPSVTAREADCSGRSRRGIPRSEPCPDPVRWLP